MRVFSFLTVLITVCVLAACVANQPKTDDSPSQSTSAEKKQTSSGIKPGMDARGNVIDPTKVESGSGRMVKGINNYEGEITGNFVHGSKFEKLQIGMSMKQVQDIVGEPTDQGGYITGKAWIPFYFGSDTTRFEWTYKGKGRLIFAGGGIGDFTGHLI